MEYEHMSYNHYQQLQEENSRESATRETNAYERGRGLNKPMGLCIPEISVHIIQPQEFKDLVQRLTGAPQFRQEISPRNPASNSSHLPDSPPTYNRYAAAESTYYSDEGYHDHWRSTSTGSYSHPSSTSSNYAQFDNNCYSTAASAYEPCYSPAYASPHSPQPFAAIDLPPLSPNDHIWAEGLHA